ncbi:MULTISPECIES: SDR family oxidoreductase [unclassified Bradyrhizobium]|uniref:SDR family NAD(P)-dependent oxidoreductase n=1 Tax=unclassified Bradyrhizobium TaxID=2631580 RepID=UPI001FF88493|nr:MULTISPECIES: SDR family oxidoreductase [unclassified Bradyrhizobium]
MKRLEGKRAVVTGGGSGIGRASAIRFAREGASVLVVGRAGNAEETAEAIRGEGGVASALITDASIEENVAAIVSRCVSEFGGMEIFFANIGVTGTNTPLLEQTVEEWSEVYRINTISCFLAIKYAGRHMTAQGYGSIILTSSAASLRANAGAISYSASKAAVNNLAQTAANAFAGTGVRVNAVLPGLVETQLTRKVFEDARARGVESKLGHVTPLKRPGRPERLRLPRHSWPATIPLTWTVNCCRSMAASAAPIPTAGSRSSTASCPIRTEQERRRGFRTTEGHHRQARGTRRVHRG